MRITTKMIANNYLSDARTNLNCLRTITNQLTSGKNISLPSDNPYIALRSMQINTKISANKQYNTNISDTLNWLDTTDESLNQVNTTLTRIRTLMVSAGNAAYGSDERKAISDEINQRISELGQILNGNFDGKYLFGGTKTASTPIYIDKDSNGNTTLYYGDKNKNPIKDDYGAVIVGVDQNGDLITSDGSKAVIKDPTDPTGQQEDENKKNKYKKYFSYLNSNVKTEISQGVTIEYNITATDVVNYSDDGNLFNLLNSIVNELQSPDPSKVTGEYLDEMDKAIANVSSLRAEVGAKQNRMESAKSQNIDENFSLTEILSETEDVDLTEATINYATAQTVYQATLQVSAQILPRSLLDYL